MDIQKEVELFLNKIENNEINDINTDLTNILVKIKKQKNIKLFYKLLINKLNSRIINLFNTISNTENENEKLKIEKIVKKESEFLILINDEYSKFKLKYKEEKMLKTINKMNFIVKKENLSFKNKIKNSSELSDVQKEIYQKLNYNSFLDEYKIEDVIISFTYFIKNVDVENNKTKILNNTNIVCTKLYEYLFNQPEIFIEFNSLIDTLTTEIRKYEKDSVERKILKEVNKKFIDIYNIYKNEINEKDNNPYFELLEYWLNDENNYLFISELFRRKTNLCNTYNNEKHIIIYILEKYIENFKKMIIDKNGDYINKNYLKEIYFLFTKSDYLKISKEEKDIIDNMLKEFSLYIKETLIKEKRKNAALEEIKTMKSIHFYKRLKEDEFREFSFDSLLYDANRICNSCNEYVKNKECVEAFLVGDNAYSIIEKEDEISLCIYSFDIHMFATKNSIIDLYFEKCEFENENIDDLISRIFSFKLNKKYPTICYELKFYKSGKFKELVVRKENILINQQFKVFSQLNNDFINLYEKSINKNGGTTTTYNLNIVNNHFENILNEEFVKFIQENKLPFIYCGYRLPSIDDINNNMNQLTPILHNLDKDIAYEIINIVSSKIDRKHYSIYPIENAIYDLRLINPFSYIGLEHQRMLGNIYFNEYDFIDENKKNKEKNSRLNKYDDIVRDLNSFIEYVDPTEIRESKGKIKRRLKI